MGDSTNFYGIFKRPFRIDKIPLDDVVRGLELLEFRIIRFTQQVLGYG